MLRSGAVVAAVAAVAAIAVLAACDLDTTDPFPQQNEWHGLLEGAEGWEHLGGQAAFVSAPGAAMITAAAEISGDEPGAIRPWHVHHNTCAQGGAIVGSDADYPRLVIDTDGRAGVATNVPVAEIDITATYHVNIHLSEEEMDVIIACADLERVTG